MKLKKWLVIVTGAVSAITFIVAILLAIYGKNKNRTLNLIYWS